jgi:arginyl-tRNA synthetase
LKEDIEPAKKAFRVALSAKTAETIKASLGLLGIAVPERM